MKRYLVLVALFLTSLPGFGSHAQPSASSQFHIKRSHKSYRANSKEIVHPHGAAARPSAPVKSASAIPVRKGHFSNRVLSHTSSATSISFVAAARTQLGGQDDDETAPVMGDFNGDGKKDVAKIVTNIVGQNEVTSVSVVLGNGDGTFQAAQLTTSPEDTDDPILVGDLNGDGKDDIILATSGYFYVLLSNGDGTFTVGNSGNSYAVTQNYLMGGLLTDLNGDGKLDLLAFDSANPANVIEVLGNGDGTFQTASTLATLPGAAPYGMLFADFNGDGKIDFAGYSGGQLAVSLGSGNGTFSALVPLTTANAQYNGCTYAFGDLTGDGNPEIIEANCGQNTVTVYVNNGDGTFQSGLYYDSNFNINNFPLGIAVADMNGDGHNDIVLTNDESGNVTILLGNGDGTVYAQAVSYDVGGNPWTPPLVADFNGDGLMDIVLSDDIYNLVYLQGYGDGSFRAGVSYPLPDSFTINTWSYSIAAGDFNGDGIPDVVVGQQLNFAAVGVTVYIAKGDGTFYPGVNYGPTPFLTQVAVADFNGDGKLDIAATDPNDGIVQILLGNGDGTFTDGAFYPTDTSGSPQPDNVVTGDFNHDGKVDLAIANPYTGTIGVLLGNGNGTFQPVTSYPLQYQSPYQVVAADLNGDGYLDLAALTYTDGPSSVAILLANNDNTGTFQAPAYITVNGGPNVVAFGDLNNDGKVDMALTLSNGTYPGTVEIALGNGDGTFQTATDYPSSAFDGGQAYTDPGAIKMFDFNGDGNLDLVYINNDFGTVAVMAGNGDGTVATPLEFPTTQYVWGMTLADVNNDGAMDVLTANDVSGGVNVLLNGNGTGTAGNYTLGTQTPSQTVTAGGSATYTLNLAGSNGYSGTITFTCSNLPTGAACSFSPSSVVANGNVPITTTMTITTTAAASANLQLPSRPMTKPGSPILLASFGGIGIVGLVLAGSGKKGRQRRAAIALGVLLLLTLGVVGCDDNDNAKTVTASTNTPAGAYVVTVTSTGTGTSAPTHSLGVTLVVQ